MREIQHWTGWKFTLPAKPYSTRLFMNQGKSLLSMRCLLLGFSLELVTLILQAQLWTSVFQYINRLALEKPVSQEKKGLTSPEVRAAVRRPQRLGTRFRQSGFFFLLEYQEEGKGWQTPTPFAPCASTLQYLQTTLSLSSHSSLKRNLVCR